MLILYTMSLSSNTSLSPDGGYGWICVAACFSINCFTWGAVSVRCLSIDRVNGNSTHVLTVIRRVLGTLSLEQHVP